MTLGGFEAITVVVAAACASVAVIVTAMAERIPYCGAESYVAWAKRESVLDRHQKTEVTYRGSATDLATDFIYAFGGRPDRIKILIASVEHKLRDESLMAYVDARIARENEARS